MKAVLLEKVIEPFCWRECAEVIAELEEAKADCLLRVAVGRDVAVSGEVGAELGERRCCPTSAVGRERIQGGRCLGDKGIEEVLLLEDGEGVLVTVRAWTDRALGKVHPERGFDEEDGMEE